MSVMLEDGNKILKWSFVCNFLEAYSVIECAVEAIVLETSSSLMINEPLYYAEQ